MNPFPRVAVIVLNWNGLEDTRECAQSLATCTYPQMRVYLVDNGSGGNEADTLQREFPLFTNVAFAENLGFTGGNNAVIERAIADGTEAVLLLNNDTVVAPDFLEPMVQALQNPNVGMVGPKILYHAEPNVLWWAGGKVNFGAWYPFVHQGENEPDSEVWSKSGPTDFITGCALLVRTEVIQKVGVLDRQFGYYCEDVEWCLRTKQAGYELRYIPGSRVWHKVSRTMTRAGMRTAYYQHRNALLVARRYISPRRFAGVLWRAIHSAVLYTGGDDSKPALLQAVWDALRGRVGVVDHPGTARVWHRLSNATRPVSRLWWRVHRRLPKFTKSHAQGVP